MTTPAPAAETFNPTTTTNVISSPSAPASSGTPQLFTQEQVRAAVEKARAEAKDELFGRIDTVQSVLKEQEDKIKV